MKRAWVVLTAERDAIFTATAATLGGHEGLGHVPGSALLGWVASRLYSKLDAAQAFKVFHSGQVRFGDGWPLTSTEAIALPVPASLRQRKRTKGGMSDHRLDDVLNFQFDERFPEQAEAIKNWYAAPDGSVCRPARGWRGKTAIQEGGRRAEVGQFFGYDFIQAGASFAALIEGENIDNNLWSRILATIDQAQDGLRLGRSRQAEFGRFSVRVEKEATVIPWATKVKSVPQAGWLTIWCLSDLSLDDPVTGCPSVEPLPEHFGLTAAGARFCRQRSFITSRRYAPFNLKLGRRDIDRCVIAAGSVLTFVITEPSDLSAVNTVCANAVGLYREGGLGRVWVDPPMLSGPKPKFVESPIFLANGRSDVAWPAKFEAAASGMATWARARLDRGNSSILIDQQARNWANQIKRLLDSLEALSRSIPAAAQWGNLAEICRKAKDDKAVGADVAALCRRTEWGEVAVVDEGPNTLRTLISDFLGTPDDLSAGVSRVQALRLAADLIKKEVSRKERK